MKENIELLSGHKKDIPAELLMSAFRLRYLEYLKEGFISSNQEKKQD
jgi:hypothetical protein